MKKGFTLIELLVVVLIIGILAAVALPQYQQAVDKARYAELISLVSTLAKAEEIYFMPNGQYTDDFSELDISLPLERRVEGSSTDYVVLLENANVVPTEKMPNGAKKYAAVWGAFMRELVPTTERFLTYLNGKGNRKPRFKSGAVF